MAYPAATPEQVAFYDAHGWLVVEDAIPQADLDEIERHCDMILADKHNLAFDWAWDAKEKREDRSFRIVQSSPSFVWKDVKDMPYRKWLVDFGRQLTGLALDFWYDQFLGKPPNLPGQGVKSVATDWHQDEGYWGRNLRNKGATCWIPLQDVDASNGCMHFIDGAHRGEVLTHQPIEGMASDILHCRPELSKIVVCPIRRGSVTFHHSNMPHMTTANLSDRWRKAVSNHMQAHGAGGEGDHYPWKFYVNQRTGEKIVPQTRADGVPEEMRRRT